MKACKSRNSLFFSAALFRSATDFAFCKSACITKACVLERTQFLHRHCVQYICVGWKSRRRERCVTCDEKENRHHNVCERDQAAATPIYECIQNYQNVLETVKLMCPDILDMYFLEYNIQINSVIWRFSLRF